MTEAESAPRTFSEAEFRHLLTLELRRCPRYQDFLSLCLIRASGPGVEDADLESGVRRHVADMLRATDFVGGIGPGNAGVAVPPTGSGPSSPAVLEMASARCSSRPGGAKAAVRAHRWMCVSASRASRPTAPVTMRSWHMPRPGCRNKPETLSAPPGPRPAAPP